MEFVVEGQHAGLAVDLGAPLQPSLTIRDRINKGQIPGPHMLMSGPWIARLSPEVCLTMRTFLARFEEPLATQ